MESGQMVNKGMKVENPSETESMSSGGTKFTSGFQRQTSASKINCLCSPTSHAGSFRCRLHRSPSLQRTKSIDSASLRDSETNINTTADDTSNAHNWVPVIHMNVLNVLCKCASTVATCGCLLACIMVLELYICYFLCFCFLLYK